MLLIRIKTVLGHLSSLQKGITLESNPELPQFPVFTKSAQHCKLSLFYHIAFLKSISYEVSSDSLYSHDFFYVSAESSPENLAKQNQNGTRFQHSSDTAVLPWSWQHRHRQASWTLPSRYIHSEMTHSLSMRKYIRQWNILHIFYRDMKEKDRPSLSLQNKLSFSAQKKLCRFGDNQKRPVPWGQSDVRGWSRVSTQTLPDWWLDSGPSIRRHRETRDSLGDRSRCSLCSSPTLR